MDIKVLSSYSRGDKVYHTVIEDWVDNVFYPQLTKKLSIHRDNLMCDERNLHPGQHKEQFFSECLTKADVVLIFLSKNYINKLNDTNSGSKYVRFEYDLISTQLDKKLIIPFLINIDPQEVPSKIIELHNISYFEPLEQIMSELEKTFNKYINKRSEKFFKTPPIIINIKLKNVLWTIISISLIVLLIVFILPPIPYISKLVSKNENPKAKPLSSDSVADSLTGVTGSRVISEVNIPVASVKKESANSAIPESVRTHDSTPAYSSAQPKKEINITDNLRPRENANPNALSVRDITIITSDADRHRAEVVTALNQHTPLEQIADLQDIIKTLECDVSIAELRHRKLVVYDTTTGISYDINTNKPHDNLKIKKVDDEKKDAKTRHYIVKFYFWGKPTLLQLRLVAKK